ncbi:MAG: hypothetical protein CMI74_08755 [Candidatus Pelagibacter sp.]|nr:hypothetical protein [Candidatus Pelagibacter sp.]
MLAFLVGCQDQPQPEQKTDPLEDENQIECVGCGLNAVEQTLMNIGVQSFTAFNHSIPFPICI